MTAFIFKKGVKYFLEAAITGGASKISNVKQHLMTNSSTDASAPTSTWNTTDFTAITGTNYAAKSIVAGSSAGAFSVSQASTDGTKSWEIATTGTTWRGDSAGDWTAARSVIMTSTSGAIEVGKQTALFYADLSAARTLSSTNDTLNVTVTMQEKTT